MTVFLSLFVPIAAADTGFGIGINMTVDTSGFEPSIWMDPDSRVFLRSPGNGGAEAIERVNNYAFEGEQIAWDVLVMDRNGIDDIDSVAVTVGSTQGTGNPIEANCDLGTFTNGQSIINFNAVIDGEQLLNLNVDTMAIYTCTLTVETPNPMYGEFWVVGEVEDDGGNRNTFDENEFWFFNPVIEIAVEGMVDFGLVNPGSMSHSDTLTITNNADEGSGVLLDMQISGTDFYDSGSGGAKCPVTNRLRLNNLGTAPIYDNEGATNPAAAYVRADQSACDSILDFSFDGVIDTVDSDDNLGVEGTTGGDGVDNLCYFATNGAYSTAGDTQRRDDEGYVGISYDTGDDDNRDPIISSMGLGDIITLGTKAYFAGNVLTPGADLSITFRLLLPEPCAGNFDTGSIFFWGEAI